MNLPADRIRLLRSAGLLLLGGLAVHWMRYLFAYGSQAGAELGDQGHSYLADLLPVVLTLSLALVLAAGLLRLLTFSCGAPARHVGGGAPAYGLALLAVYSSQELAEGVVDPGHASGLAALAADGGWVALPLAFAVGALITLVESLLGRAEEEIWALVAGAEELPARRAPSPQAEPAFRARVPIISLTLAFGFARRPPPATLSV